MFPVLILREFTLTSFFCPVADDSLPVRSGLRAEICFCYDFQNRNIMTLLSPVDDFTNRTLAAISGSLGRLHYIAGLRDGGSAYRHWGLERVHGREEAEAAIGQAHAEVLLDVLRTPIRVLARELKETVRLQGEEAGRYLGDLHEAKALPAGISEASARHFSSVLLALDALARRKAGSTRQSS